MRTPHLHAQDQAFVADDATVVGDVSLGRDVSIWYGCVVRGDVAPIRIGSRTNIQDLSVVHPQHDEPVTIGEDCVVGHQVTLHCSDVGSRCLVGMGAILLPGARIGDRCLVAAGAIVPMGMEVPDGSMIMGQPARIIREVRDDELRTFDEAVERYLSLVREHLA